MRRVIGIDVRRTFGEMVVWEDGRLRHAGRIDMTRTALEGFDKTLLASDEVVVEATANSMGVSRVLAPFVARVIVANPLQVKAIAQAHVKTDKIDAGTLASLQAAGYVPQIWTPDAETERKRRLVARRYQVVRHRTRLKNEVHSILHAHLIPKCPHADLFNGRGRAWLAAQPLPDDERAAIDRHVRELDRLAEDLALLDREIAQDAIDDSAVNRLMTITGVNLAVAAGIVAAIGDISRFNGPQKLVSYFGLNPRVRQSGLGAAHHGRISKIGRSHARAMLVEAAWAAAKAPGPLHAFFVLHPRPARPSDRRGGRGPEAHRALLAFVDEGRGLPVGATGTGRHQDPRDAASSRTSATERQPAWASVCLQHQGIARPRDVDCRPGRAKLRALGDAMETTAAKNRRAGASARQDKIGQPGGACSRCATLRHEVARARQG
ncbi:transposase [Bradyrhizobium sp. USDA 3240]